MSVRAFPDAIGPIRLSKADRESFPDWVQRYADFLGLGEDELLPVDAPHLIPFLRRLRDQRMRAGERLQAAKALECYRTTVLSGDHPSAVGAELALAQLESEETDSAADVWRDLPSAADQVTVDLTPCERGLLRD